MAIPYWSEIQQKWILDVHLAGKRRTFVSRTPGKKGLAAIKKAYQDALLGESDKSGWRLNKCWVDYLVEVKKMTSTSQYRQCEIMGRLYVLPKIGHKKAGTITDQDWQDCITQATPVNIKKAMLSKKTLADLRSVISNFCRYAVKARMIERLPVGLRLPKDAPNVEKGILQPDQLRLLFEPIPAWYGNAWRLMAVTGFRPGEVFGLQWDDIQDGVLRIHRTINFQNEITPGKNKNAKRGIVLHPIALSVIESQKALLKRAEIDSKWLFPDEDGSDPCQKNGYKQWTHYRKITGITIPPYGLRHTFVSLTQHIVPLAMLKQLVGHSENMDTHGTYGHEVVGDMVVAAELVDQALKKWLK